MAGSNVRWPFNRIGLTKSDHPNSVSFNFRASDPVVVCNFTGIVSASAAIDIAAIYNAIANAPTTLPTSTFPVSNRDQASYLDLFLCSLTAAPTGTPKVRAFGAKIISNEGPGNQWHPTDANSKFDPLGSTIEAPTGVRQGLWWKPLYNPTTGDHVQTFPASSAEIAIAGATNGPEYRTGQLTYFVAGCDIVVVLGCTAPGNLGAAADQLVVGQFGG